MYRHPNLHLHLHLHRHRHLHLTPAPINTPTLCAPTPTPTHTCTLPHMHTHACTHARTHARTHTHRQTDRQTHTQTYAHTHTHTCRYTYTHTRIYTRTHIYKLILLQRGDQKDYSVHENDDMLYAGAYARLPSTGVLCSCVHTEFICCMLVRIHGCQARVCSVIVCTLSAYTFMCMHVCLCSYFLCYVLAGDLYLVAHPLCHRTSQSHQQQNCIEGC